MFVYYKILTRQLRRLSSPMICICKLETHESQWCSLKARQPKSSGMGIHVTPWLIHVSVWQNPLKCCEVISLQLIKINGKKKSSGIDSSQSLMPENQERWGQERIHVPGEQSSSEQASSTFLFSLGPQLIGWCLPHQGGPSALSSPPIQMIISSRNTLSDPHRNNV